MSERRYSPLATLFAATFLFRIGNAVAALALPWFVLSHTKSAAWAGATAASSVIATIIGAWVGGGLVDRFGRAPVALISGDLKKEARDYVAILLEMYLLCPTLRNPATNE